MAPRYHPEMVEIVKGSYTCAQNSFVTATLTENFQSCALVDVFFLWQVGMYTCILNWGPYDEFFFGGVVWDEWSQGDYFEATNLKFGSRLEMYILGGGFKYVFHFHRSPLLGEMIQFD